MQTEIPITCPSWAHRYTRGVDTHELGAHVWFYTSCRWVVSVIFKSVKGLKAETIFNVFNPLNATDDTDQWKTCTYVSFTPNSIITSRQAINSFEMCHLQIRCLSHVSGGGTSQIKPHIWRRHISNELKKTHFVCNIQQSHLCSNFLPTFPTFLRHLA